MLMKIRTKRRDLRLKVILEYLNINSMKKKRSF
jgi:hypothetical protein